VKAPIAKTPSLRSKLFEALPQWPIVRDSQAFVSEHSSMETAAEI
jgi:hypothetical protein